MGSPSGQYQSVRVTWNAYISNQTSLVVTISSGPATFTVDRQIIISPPDVQSLAKVLRQLSDTSFSWIYLGQNIGLFHRSQKKFFRQGICIDATQKFHQASEELRDPYLIHTYQLLRGQNNLKWWTTALAYRSGYVSKAFHNICYLKIALDLVDNGDINRPLVIVTEDSVCGAIEKNLSLRGFNDYKVFRRADSPTLTWLKKASRMLAHRARFLAQGAYRIFKSRRETLGQTLPTQMTTLIVTWITAGNVSMGSKYHEAYFGDLAHKLGQRGVKVTLVPMILRDVRYIDALYTLKDVALPVLNPHRCLKYRDLLWAAISSCARPQLPRECTMMCEMDVRLLIKDDINRHWEDNSAADSLLMAALVNRWSNLGIEIERIVYIYENQPWERALCWETRRVFPKAQLIGYQHARAPRMGLNWYLAPGGESEAPLPDRVVTVGKHNATMLSTSGYRPGTVRVGGALQMQNILALADDAVQDIQIHDGRTILVAPSNGIEEASALVDMAINLFDEKDGIRILLKYHPLLPSQKVMDYLGARLPAHVMVSEKPITELIQSSSIMVYTSSLVCAQALALGLPVIQVKNQFDLNTDPLENVPDLRLEAASLPELREKVSWLLEHREEYITLHSKAWRTTVEDIYSPVTEETVDAFVS